MVFRTCVLHERLGYMWQRKVTLNLRFRTWLSYATDSVTPMPSWHSVMKLKTLWGQVNILMKPTGVPSWGTFTKLLMGVGVAQRNEYENCKKCVNSWANNTIPFHSHPQDPTLKDYTWLSLRGWWRILTDGCKCIQPWSPESTINEPLAVSILRHSLEVSKYFT